MKYLFIILTICLFSCNEPSYHVKETTIYLHNGSGWSATTSSFRCDSVKMLSKSEAIYYVGGKELKVYADYLTISR
jgi:hypothetical protein